MDFYLMDLLHKKQIKYEFKNIYINIYILNKTF